MNFDIESVEESTQDFVHRHGLLVKHATVGVLELGLGGEIAGLNPKACEWLAVEALERVRGQALSELLPESCRAELARALARASQGEDAEFDCLLRKKVRGRFRFFPLRNPEGQVTSLYGLVNDRQASSEVLDRLQDSEHRYRELFEFSQSIKFLLDAETGGILEANGAACEFYGYSLEEFKTLSLFEIKSLLSDDLREASIRESRGLRRGVEFSHRTKSGQLREVEVISGPVETPEGERIYTVVHDLTARKDFEHVMERERFAFAIAGSRDGIWDWDVASDHSWWSPRLYELLGFGDGEFVPCREVTYAMMHPEDREETREVADRHLASGEPFNLTYRMRGKGGGYRWFQVRGQSQLNDQGEATRVCGSFTDVDEEINTALAREEREARLAKQQACVLELATDPMLAAGGFRQACMRITELASDVLDAGRCSVLMLAPGGSSMESVDLYVRETGVHSHGRPLDGMEFPKFFAELQAMRVIVCSDPFEDERFSEFSSDYIRERKVRAIIEVPVRREGRLVGVVAVSETRYDREWHEDEVDFALNLAQQVSRLLDAADAHAAEKKQRDLERQMLQAQKMESLGLMAGGVAHDFNNLLVVILGNADLLKSTLARNPGKLELVNEICAASIQAAELCQQMMAFTGRGRLSPTHFDLQELVQELCQLLRISVPKQATLEFKRGSKQLSMVGDATQVRQVVMNVILNACESLCDGPGQITIKAGKRIVATDTHAIGLSVPREGEYLFLEVQDSGGGMDQETLAKLFDPFFTTKFAGRGLGMAAVLGIMRAHNGGIHVRSAPNEGSRFEIWFPVASADHEITQPRTIAESVAWTGSGTVLLVDDQPAVLRLGKQMLERLGFEVHVASAGREAVEFFVGNHRDLALVVLDLTMPEMSGEQVHAALQEIDPCVPIILSSGYTADDVHLGTELAGSWVFLQKPYTLQALRNCARGLLG
ncbi:MAG: PAS domain S-box-containing protein [Planctomycetota bacterium]|jgi:PAS domain S-box-containing protein